MRLSPLQKDLLTLTFFVFAVLTVVLTLSYSAGRSHTQATMSQPDLGQACQGKTDLAAPTAHRTTEPKQPGPPEPRRLQPCYGCEPLRPGVEYCAAEVPIGNAEVPPKLPTGGAKPFAHVAVEEPSPGGQAELRIRTPEPPPEFTAAASPAVPGSLAGVKIPLSGSMPPEAGRIEVENGMVSIVIRNASLNEVLAALAQQQGLNLITAEDITARVSVTLDNVPFEQALTHILAVAGYTWVRQENILIITSITAGSKLSPYAQGREVRVFRLDYVSAVDIDLVVNGFLSPAGQSFATQSANMDDRKTQELLVVEDLPVYLGRIEQYIQQVDVPPRQVLIEVHVLSIELEDNVKHGVNLEYLNRLANPSITVRTQGFANAAGFTKGTSPAFFFNVAASELNTLLEAIESTTDARTLATPKVLVLNGQEARFQVGEQLGYRVTTTTQTSSLESVDFLDVGVVLVVTPRITKDNHVVMHVKPEVSSGRINADTELPEEETTHVETSVMLPDGHGMLIGGLIQEADVETESKIPFLGDLWLIGRLFQRHSIERKRTEIIIALIPHIVPYDPLRQQRECEQFFRATTPLMYGPLLQNPRPYEPRFPDAGQRLPLRYKMQDLCTMPDSGAWVPQASGEHCTTGEQTMGPTFYDPASRVPTPYNTMPHDAVPLQQGTLEPRGIPQEGEIIPTPMLPQTP